MSEQLGSRTVLQVILASLAQAAVHNRSVTVAPAAVLWPDEGRHWEPLLPLLREAHPYLLTLGPFAPEQRTGPAIWLRCMLGGELDAATWPADAVPVAYLPGVSRSMLRAVESCPKHLQPLAELQYRGVFWSQVNGKDWTVLAFLKSAEGGLGLDVAQDHATLEALHRALVQLADTDVDSLRGRRLEAADLDRLLTTDPTRDILRWLNDPAGTRQGWGEGTWGAFRSVCKTEFAFDPQADGELVGAERLGLRQGPWAGVWARFAEAPRLYLGIPALLEKAQPRNLDLFADRSTWPQENEQGEADLRKALLVLSQQAPAAATAQLRDLERRHGKRRGWVWADLGGTPLACAVGHLARLAEVAEKPVSGSTVEEMGAEYVERAWRADAGALDALACVELGEDLAAVTAALRAVHLPWLEACAQRLQEQVTRSNYPTSASGLATPGVCTLFVDGFRLDLARRLEQALRDRGYEASLGFRWAGLPSVTATGKPEVSPVAGAIIGSSGDEDFTPHVAATGKPLSSYHFGKLLTDFSVQVLGDDAGDPTGSAWCEAGDLDRSGHDQGWKLARRVGEELRELGERVELLLEAGWKEVRIITDHGWLLMPGGLPKAHLPTFLAETRWGRCALLKPGAQPSGLIVHWRWSTDINVALAPGVHCYREGMDYAHGGLSLQECVTPVLRITAGATTTGMGRLTDVTWLGLRCRARVEQGQPGQRVDLRTKPADKTSSLINGGKEVAAEGKVSLVVADDSLIGTAAVLVVVDAKGIVVAKMPTTVGGGD